MSTRILLLVMCALLLHLSSIILFYQVVYSCHEITILAMNLVNTTEILSPEFQIP